MRKTNGLASKINQAFIFQATLISVAVLLSVFFAKVVLEEIMIKKAVIEEAEFYWKNRNLNTEFPLPSTRNLTGYQTKESLPSIIQSAVPDRLGFYELQKEELVLQISELNGERLYLVYQRGQVDALALYYGLIPLSLVLIVLYLSLWLTYRFSRRSVSPISWLARQVDQIDVNAADRSLLHIKELPFDADDDVAILASAIVDLGNRLDRFVEREHNFTRDASHELRSPLTVMNIAVEMLAEEDLSESAQQTLERIKRAVREMEELTETFLVLARETDQTLSTGSVCINDVIDEEIERSRLISKNQDLDIVYSPDWNLETEAPDKVLSVLFGNLIRNAMQYTKKGRIQISIQQDTVVIQDSGKGISETEISEMFKPFRRGEKRNGSGYGVGLTIVRRLSDRFHWPLNIDSKPGLGTTVKVRFPTSVSTQKTHNQASSDGSSSATEIDL